MTCPHLSELNTNYSYHSEKCIYYQDYEHIYHLFDDTKLLCILDDSAYDI